MGEKCPLDKEVISTLDIRTVIRTLSTGEKFYTNMSRSGYTPHGEGQVSLDQYVARLREKFSSVVVKQMAIDITGRLLEDDVAIFVKK